MHRSVFFKGIAWRDYSNMGVGMSMIKLIQPCL